MPQRKNSLQKVMRQNDLITYAYSRFLNHMPDFFNADMVKKLAEECAVSEEEALLSLFSAAIGLEPDIDSEHRELENAYLRPGLHRLSPADYQSDAYYRRIKLPACRRGDWELRESAYTPYELFVCNHPTQTKDLREIPQIGYFPERFPFPAVLENGIEWMSVTPNEIETMKEPIAHAHGRVLTLGLGLGYFAFHAAEKEEVSEVTVAELNPDVIALFRELILPQFPHAEKIKLVEGDALAFLDSPGIADRFDSVFADLWHDQSDGLPLYLRLRRIERAHGIRNMDYWIEPTLLSSLRRMVYDKLNDPKEALRLNGISQEELLSDEFLRRLAPDVKGI